MNDYPIIGDPGDVVGALRRNIRPSPAESFRRINRLFKQTFTINRIEPTCSDSSTSSPAGC